ncbi:hypothetical protein N5910_00215 [Methanothermobacter wolfeii]|uniref:Uncharacterized protein n=1 Tax=Methanothermobacter wolfeii TaxID=145261 RepID=A0A9E7RT88_METWO|nr:hypothetical protein [Methanothermobacter wolfeii]UXH31773.1 hypothetical protein N5910_00215 [Methanothermobacter wolfeii]
MGVGAQKHVHTIYIGCQLTFLWKTQMGYQDNEIHPFLVPEDFNPVWKFIKAKGEFKAPAEPWGHHLIHYVGCYSDYTN